MVKLKILKDIEKDVDPYHIPVNIREEAIKWVKDLQNYLDTHSFGTVNQNYTEFEENATKGQISWIKHFFDIKDEDLKPKLRK